jgi:acyl carrier protein
MSNEQKLRQVFADGLDVPLDAITDTITYNEFPAWDSIAHMALVAGIDMQFNTMLEMDDILDMSSFIKAKEILGKLGVSFDS